MDWMTLLNQILDIILPAAASLVAIWFGILGSKMKASYTEKVNTETKKAVVQSTVEYIEQVYKDIHRQEKQKKEVKKTKEILNKKGLTVSETELKTLLESAVYGLSQGWLEDTAYELTPAGKELIQEEQPEEQEA